MISKSLQENILTLLVFSEEHGRHLSGLVDATHFDGTYRLIAAKAIAYIYEYKKAPQAHIADLLETELKNKELDQKHLKSILLDLKQNSYEVNAPYVFSRLQSFLTMQRLKSGIIDAAEKLQTKTEDANEEAEKILYDALKARAIVTDLGVRLSSPDIAQMILTRPVAFPTGIKELDREHLGPGRKELHVLMALPNRGKSWWLIHLGRVALLNKLKVVHITCEMSSVRVLERYAQNIFSIPQRNISTKVTKVSVDDHNKITNIFQETVQHAFTLEDPAMEKKLNAKLKRWRTRLHNIVVKEFPSGSLTVRQLAGYLDTLEMAEHFTPDLILIDYADLMKINPARRREELGEIYVQLRGLAMERNCAVTTVTQSNREGLKSKHHLSEGNVGEDFSKVQTADVLLSYNQTEVEKELGVARIYVNKARNERAAFSFLLTQNYSAGQFCLQTAACSERYFALTMSEDDKEKARQREPNKSKRKKAE